MEFVVALCDRVRLRECRIAHSTLVADANLTKETVAGAVHNRKTSQIGRCGPVEGALVEARGMKTPRRQERSRVADHQDKPETQLSSAGRKSKEHFGVVNTPVYRASTILYPSVAALEARDMPYTYGRQGNPTVESLEVAITALECAKKTVFVPSGLNAVATALLTVCSSGDHVLMTDSCYAPSRAF